MDLSEIKGIGTKRVEQLASMNINSVYDLVTCFPRGYTDFQEVDDSTGGGFVKFKGRIITQLIKKIARSGRSYSECLCSMEDKQVKLMWFQDSYIISKLKPNTEYFIKGKLTNDSGRYSIISPLLTTYEKGNSLTSNYNTRNIMSQNQFGDIVQNCLKQVNFDTMINDNASLMELNTALKKIHTPKVMTDVYAAKSRIALEEIVQLMTAIKICRADNIKIKSHKYVNNLDKINEIKEGLPFELTADQLSSTDKIIALMNKDECMNAMLIGDVGSGKTIVGMQAMAYAFTSGFQSAIMAPTEILAKQHLKHAINYFGESNVAFYSGSLTAKEKRLAKERIESGEAKVIIGTHALFSSDVIYDDLTLIITDEQHRFGVRQRSSLINKGRSVDVLVMSATPIPRTLSLAVYGDLDIITIKTRPQGRKVTNTAIVPKNKYDDMIGYLKKIIAKESQAYVVCPSIYKSDSVAMNSVESVFERLSRELEGIEIDFLHGDMKEELKQEKIEKFRNGKTRLLVSTTIIEVGVDVSNADIMIIFDAERFGLSSLHQLRGRVGRGHGQGQCFLISDNTNKTTIERLKILVNNSSGFDICEKDFKLRGAGDLLGDRQSGFFDRMLKGLTIDGKVVEQAQKIVSSQNTTREEFLKIAFDKFKGMVEIIL